MKVLVLGVTGMLGHAVFKLFSADDRYDTWGTLRGASGLGYFSDHLKSRLLPGIDVLDQDVLADVLAKVRPDVVINCVGLIKQLSSANDPLSALPINAMLPHRLAKLCALLGARLVHISTDCVFQGARVLILSVTSRMRMIFMDVPSLLVSCMIYLMRLHCARPLSAMSWEAAMRW